MKNISNALIAEKNKVNSSSPWLILIEITLTDENSTVLRFVRNTEDVTFETHLFSAANFQLDPFVYSSKGDIPTFSLKVENVVRLIQPYLETLNGGVGSIVRIIVVNHSLLNEDYSELEEEFSVIGCSCDTRWVNFILGASSPLRRRMPLHRYIAMCCRWSSWFGGVECKYDWSWIC